MNDEQRKVIGILALQGAFAEHQTALQRLPYHRRFEVILVKTVEELNRCDALIIPGGESTTIALLARISGLLDPLRQFILTKPVWGTCAGAILLSQSVENAKKGGQDLLGGMSITIARNGWGSQLESFEAELHVPGLSSPSIPFKGIFIRAPVVLSLTPTPTSPILIIAKLASDLLPPSLPTTLPPTPTTHPDPDHNPSDDPKNIVALRQGLHFLTTFHPELTDDNRFHDYFVRECVLTTGRGAS